MPQPTLPRLFANDDGGRGGVDDNILYRALQHNESRVPLHQMTASAVGNTPERDLDMVKEGILRGVMHADEHMFKFKVCPVSGVYLAVAYSHDIVRALEESS